MLGLTLVRPLEEGWRETLDAVGVARGWPTSREPAKLGKRVAELSSAYNDATRARASLRDAGAARLGFSFARDVPKGAAAVRELIATGALRMDLEATLRLLDIGAGLGATTWGVVRALEAAGARGTVEATWVDTDEAALEVALAIARARESRAGAVNLRVRTVVRRADDSLDGLPRFDLVLAGQLFSELDVGLADEERAARHADVIATWLERRAVASGSLVVVEPALRDRTRALHRVRDLLVARAGVTLFAPCLHAGHCPALARPTDWCHEDLPVDLPGWLEPVARCAGLRREGLTFSYLVLRKDGVRLADQLHAGPSAAKLRVVSSLLPSKGKLEALVCGELDELDGQRRLGGARAVRLNREASASNGFWEDVVRGDVILVDPAPPAPIGGGALLRIGPAARVVDAAEWR
jgi:SAM-dependent methyltransferase